MINDFQGRKTWVGIVSSGRPGNVSRMEALLREVRPTWHIEPGDEADYLSNGAVPSQIRICGPEYTGVTGARNSIIDAAQPSGAWCVQFSDDLKKLQRARTKKDVSLLPVAEAISLIMDTMEAQDLFLGGVAPTANAFYFDPRKQITSFGFIVGDFTVIRPNPLRYDEAFRTREDYDYSLQHIQYYGGIVRRNDILATFLHRTNPGGCCSPERRRWDRDSVALLKSRWGSLIRNHPRRPGEILIAAPRIDRKRTKVRS